MMLTSLLNSQLQAKLCKKYGNDVKFLVTTSAYLQSGNKAKRQKIKPKPALSLEEEEVRVLRSEAKGRLHLIRLD
jgi:hypothetical protein